MKKIAFLLMMAMMLGMSTTANAKKTMVPKMHMFGIAASFNDSIVYFTNIQEVDSAWIESKNHFLLDRHVFAAELREYLANRLQMPHRTCIVYYDTDRTKLEKKFVKVRSLYMPQKKKKKKQARQYDIRYVETADFHFKALDSSFYIEEPTATQDEQPGK